MKYRLLTLLGLACLLAACGRGIGSDQPPPPDKNRPKVATAVAILPTVRTIPNTNSNTAKPANNTVQTINVKAVKPLHDAFCHGRADLVHRAAE